MENLKLFCFVLYIGTMFEIFPCNNHEGTALKRVKRDATSTINAAVTLFHYPNASSISKVKINTKSSNVCAASGFSGGFYLNDILGEADVSTTVTECLAACTNFNTCIAINYLSKSKRCILLKSGATSGSQLFMDSDVSDCSHLMFANCPAKPKITPTKLASGNPPTTCGFPHFQQNLIKTVAPKIIGGTEAVPYSYPWIGLLLYDLGGGVTSYCGMSVIYTSNIIQSDIAITAAHCVVNEDGTSRDLKKFTFLFGNHDNRFIEPHEIALTVTKIIVHKNYSHLTLRNDIAVVKLNSSIKFNNYIQPICLPVAGKSPKDLSSCSVCGWGRIYDTNNTIPSRLQQLKLTIQSNQTCGASAEWGSLYDPNSMLCAGPLNGTQNICQGDSGGSLACYEDAHWTLYGTSSFVSADHCLAKNRPGVFSKVSGVMSFIESAISQLK